MDLACVTLLRGFSPSSRVWWYPTRQFHPSGVTLHFHARFQYYNLCPRWQNITSSKFRHVLASYLHLLFLQQYFLFASLQQDSSELLHFNHWCDYNLCIFLPGKFNTIIRVGHLSISCNVVIRTAVLITSCESNLLSSLRFQH